MPVSIYTDDDRSPRTELLSPTSGSPSQQSQSSPRDRDRERRHRRNHHHRNGPTRPHTAEANSLTSGSHNDNHHNDNRNTTSKTWWRSREKALSQSSYSKKDLIRMVISAEHETSKLHSTLTNTLTLLDTESHKCAALERDSFSAFTRLTNLRETAESLAEHTSQDLRVARFELEHRTREVKRLQRELDSEKNAREEAEKEIGRAKDTAWELRRERIMVRAREQGRREGFEKGFMKAQAENTLRMQMQVEVEATVNARPSAAESSGVGPSSGIDWGAQPGTGSASVSGWRRRPSHISVAGAQEMEEEGDHGRDAGETSYQELDSIPIVTPPRIPQVLPDGQTMLTKTGYSPIQRPVPQRYNDMVPQRESTPSPSVDRYPVSIPPQSVIEKTYGIGQPEQWVTGAEHSAFHGPTPPDPATLTIDTNTSNDGYAPTSPVKSKAKFRARRPSLKQTAASWYRSLSFMKKPKQKVLIDPEAEEDDQAGSSSAPVVHETGLSSAVAAPLTRPQSQRHSHVGSVSGASLASRVRSRERAYPPEPRIHTSQGKHKPRTSSIDSWASTPISTSQFDLLNTPGGLNGRYLRGQVIASVESPNSLSGRGGTPLSASGKSARSQAAAIPKKLSVIRENPMSRNPTPVRANFTGVTGPTPHGYAGSAGSRESLLDRRSMKSTSSRMFAVNPDPESPDLQANVNGASNAAGVGTGGPDSTAPRRQRQQLHSQEQYVFPRQPPADSALLRPASVLSGGSSAHGGIGFPVVAPLRTRKSGLSNASGASGRSGSGGAIDTPTPMPKGDKQKGKKGLYPLGMVIGDAVDGGGNDNSPGIEIAVQTPSDPARSSGQQDGIIQDARFLSPRQPPSRSLTPSDQGNATSTTKVQEDTYPSQQLSYPPRSISPIPRSTPKIFQAQGLPSVGSAVPSEERKPKGMVIKRYDGAAMLGGGSVAGSESEHQNNTNAGMTPGPALLHPLPSRASATAERQQYLRTGNGQGMYLRSEKAGSTGSLRSQGSYGKFDSSKYVDPAFWDAPSSVPAQMDRGSGQEGGYGRPMSRQSVVSYANP